MADATPTQAAQPETNTKDLNSSYEYSAQSEPESQMFDQVVEEEAIASVETRKEVILQKETSASIVVADNVEVIESKDEAVAMQRDEMKNSEVSKASRTAPPAAALPEVIMKKKTDNVEKWFVGNWSGYVIKDEGNGRVTLEKYESYDSGWILTSSNDKEAIFEKDGKKIILRKTDIGFIIHDGESKFNVTKNK